MLRSAGIEPIVRVSDVDEDAVVAALPHDTAPEAVVVELAKAKAHTVASELTAGLEGVCWLDGADAFDCVIVGCDSMLHIDGQLQGKPHTIANARERWAEMAGHSGDLLTGHSVLRLLDGKIVASSADCSSTTVHFGTPTPDDLAAYLDTGEPLKVAGAFTLDGLGGWFVDRIEGDPSSVIGIGLPLLRRLLADVNVSVAQLWAAG